MAIDRDHDDHNVAAVHDGLELLRISTADPAVVEFRDVTGLRRLLREASHVSIQPAYYCDSHGTPTRCTTSSSAVMKPTMTGLLESVKMDSSFLCRTAGTRTPAPASLCRGR